MCRQLMLRSMHSMRSFCSLMRGRFCVTLARPEPCWVPKCMLHVHTPFNGLGRHSRASGTCSQERQSTVEPSKKSAAYLWIRSGLGSHGHGHGHGIFILVYCLHENVTWRKWAHLWKKRWNARQQFGLANFELELCHSDSVTAALSRLRSRSRIVETGSHWKGSGPLIPGPRAGPLRVSVGSALRCWVKEGWDWSFISLLICFQNK